MSEPTVLIVADEGGRPQAGTIRALRRAGARVRVLTPSGGLLAHWLGEWDVPFEPLQLRRPRDAAAAETIRWHLDELRPRILQVSGPLAASNGLRAVQRRPVAIVADRGGAGKPDIMNRLDRASILSSRISRIVCCAESVRRSFLNLRLGTLKIPPRKVVAIHPGHDVHWYDCVPFDAAVLGVPRDAFVVSCLTLGSEVCLRSVIRACDHLPPDLPIYFLAIGAVAAAGPNARLIERSSYRDRFQLLGERSDVARIAAASDISVMAGADEGLPDALFESMATETAPVVGDSGAAAEVVEHERSGLVIPAGEPRAVAAAILRLFNDRETCRRLGAAARRRVASGFAVSGAADATLAVYRDLLSGPSGV
ncbi:MAG: glycosyltransferase family 4 protein [Gammaproteobacteria bacterium]|nr:glycosyltransferase family 4 protein [Gammaproteobacteria bacterium]